MLARDFVGHKYFKLTRHFKLHTNDNQLVVVSGGVDLVHKARINQIDI